MFSVVGREFRRFYEGMENTREINIAGKFIRSVHLLGQLIVDSNYITNEKEKLITRKEVLDQVVVCHSDRFGF